MLARYRSLAVPLAVVAAVVLFYMVNPWFFPAVGSTERGIATVAFWVLMIAVLVLLFEDRNAPEAEIGRGRGPGLYPLPVQQYPGRPDLAAGPPVPRASSGSSPATTS